MVYTQMKNAFGPWGSLITEIHISVRADYILLFYCLVTYRTSFGRHLYTITETMPGRVPNDIERCVKALTPRSLVCLQYCISFVDKQNHKHRAALIRSLRSGIRAFIIVGISDWCFLIYIDRPRLRGGFDLARHCANYANSRPSRKLLSLQIQRIVSIIDSTLSLL